MKDARRAPDPLTLLLTVGLGMWGCGGDSTKGGQEDGFVAGSDRTQCVYNQAYQENFAEDSLEDILSMAQNCYVLVDPFDEEVPGQIAAIKAQGNTVGCYMSVGTGEDWRTDFEQLRPYLVDRQWGQWDGEYFVRQTTTGILAVMQARIDAMAGWGCDWVEFDNMDWIFDQDNVAEYGIQATQEEGIAYNQALCAHTRQQDMRCMAKNLRQGAEDFDGVLFESYANDFNWWDADQLKGFIAEGKPAIINHYNESDCNGAYTRYIEEYGRDISFICEDKRLKRYVHFNERD